MGGAQDGNRRSRLRRVVLIGLAMLVPAVPIAIALAIGSGSGAGAATTTTESFAQAPPPPAPKAHTQSAVPGGSGALVALIVHATTVRATPSAHGHTVARLQTKTQFGSPAAFWVVDRAPGWLGVISSEAGNNRVAWIAQSSASLSRVPWELKVSLGARKLTVLDNGKVAARYTVAIGASDAPTPTGRFEVTDRLLTGDPSGPYGCCILATSAHSPHAIQGWTGGTRIAIHSTPETSSIGEAASHGCVRVTLPEGQWLLNHIPLGTPTLVSS